MTFLTIIAIVLTICMGFLCLALHEKNTNAICKSKRRLDGKTAIVTGGTSGMGLEIAKDFAHRGARVIVACPFEEEGIHGQKLIIRSSRNENVIFEHLDLSSFDSVRKFAANILEKEPRLDILVNNAGINNGDWLTKDGLNINMQVNYFGTVLLTLLLLPLLKTTGSSEEPSRIVNTSSVSHRAGKVDVGRWNQRWNYWQSYADSKLCIALFTRELAKQINSSITVNAVDPGLVGTAMTSEFYPSIFVPLMKTLIRISFKTPWEGAQSAILSAVSDDTAQKNGACFKNCKETALTYHNYDDKMCRFLWDETMNVLKFDYSVVT